MRHRTPDVVAAERVMLLTLAVEDAARRNDVADLGSLLTARGEALNELEACKQIGPEARAIIERIRQDETRTFRRLQAELTAAQSSVIQNHQDRRNVKAYGSRGSGFSAINQRS